jgi:cell division septum initiation protein DivIVA
LCLGYEREIDNLQDELSKLQSANKKLKKKSEQQDAQLKSLEGSSGASSQIIAEGSTASTTGEASSTPNQATIREEVAAGTFLFLELRTKLLHFLKNEFR